MFCPVSSFLLSFRHIASAPRLHAAGGERRARPKGQSLNTAAPPFFPFKGFSFVGAYNVPPATQKPATQKEKRRNMEITPPQRPKMNDKIKIIPPESLKTLRRLPIVSLFGEQSPDPPYLLKAAGVGILPRGDIQTLIGQAKSGKSTAARALIIALLRGEFGNVQAAQKHARAAVLLADTEQAEHNAVANAREILRVAGLDEQEENEVLRLCGSSDIWSDRVLKRRKPLNKLYI